MMLGAYSQAKQQDSLSWLDKVAQDLIQHQEIVRIKKLLIYTCTQTWASNPEQVHAADLRNLLQMLLVIAPTLEKIQLVLHSVVSALNKSAEYKIIADAIIEPIKNHYPAAIVSETWSANNDLKLTCYQTIAYALHQDPEEFRIQKLLLLVCKNVWVNNRHQLAQLDLSALVEALHTSASSIEDLHFILDSHVRKLTKSTAYRLVADKLIQALQPLYQENDSDGLLASSALELTTLNAEIPSQIIENNEIEHDSKELATQARSKPGYKPTPEQRLSTNLFDLRLEIIYYANPFRTKILFFSLLHEPFNQTTEHYLMLKNYELDTLLQAIFQTYHSFEQLNTNLLQIAKQLNDSEEYRRVAQIALRAIKAYYTQSPIASEMLALCEQNTNVDGIITHSIELTESKLS